MSRNSIYKYFIIFVLCFVFVCCHCKNGFQLQRFVVVDERLTAKIKMIYKESFLKSSDKQAVVVMLRLVDSIPIFKVTLVPKSEICEQYVYDSNSRIIGYIEEQNLPTDVILLSNIDSKYVFESTFYRFIKPTTKHKQFSYIYFPVDQYVVDKNGHGLPPYFFDPFYIIFEYRENKFIRIK